MSIAVWDVQLNIYTIKTRQSFWWLHL